MGAACGSRLAGRLLVAEGRVVWPRKGEWTFAWGYGLTGRRPLGPETATDDVCRFDAERVGRETTTHPNPPGGCRAAANVPVAITRQDTPEELCRASDHEAAP